jgi:hypothetical protein
MTIWSSSIYDNILYLFHAPTCLAFGITGRILHAKMYVHPTLKPLFIKLHPAGGCCFLFSDLVLFVTVTSVHCDHFFSASESHRANFLGHASTLTALSYWLSLIYLYFIITYYKYVYSTSMRLTWFFFLFLLLFICAYKTWFISPPCPHPLPYHPLRPSPSPPQYPAETILPLSLILL